MPFAAATREKVCFFLGYPMINSNVAHIQAALNNLENLSDSTFSGHAITRIEAWLTQLETISTNINTERDVEGTTKLQNLRYEGRRHVSLVANALAIRVDSDVFSSQASEV
jgi:hypothetical protein